MKTRKAKIATKLMIVVSVVTVLSTVLLGIISYKRERESLIAQSKDNAKNIAKSAAAMIDTDDFTAIKEGMEESKEFTRVLDTLATFRDNAGMEYIYTMKQIEDKTVFVVDSDKEEPADIYEEYDSVEKIEEVFKTGEPAVDDEVTTDEWGRFYSAYAPIMDEEKNVVGIVGVDISVEWIEKNLKAYKNAILIAGAVCVVFAVLASLLISKSIAKGLKTLYKEVEDLCEGNGDLARRIDINTGDELETIAGSMNSFLQQMRELISSLATTSESLEGTSKKLIESVEDVNGQVLSIDSSIGGLSAAMEETSASCTIIDESVMNVSEQTTELSETAMDIMSFTDTMKQRASTAKNKAESGITTANVSFAQIKNHMQESVDKAREIETIRNLASKIEEIAAQTTILSLNASIEAARAGESGRGFNVVAQSIGTLSDDISATVKDIKDITDNVIIYVDNLIEDVYKINSFIEKDVFKDYKEMSGISDSYNDDASKIAGTMQELVKTFEENKSTMDAISYSISEIASAVNDCVEQITIVGTSTSVIAEHTELLQGLSKENGESADVLMQYSSKYRY